MRAKWALALLLVFAEPLAEHPSHFELQFLRNVVWIRSGALRTRWFRERAGLPVRVIELASGRRIYWLPSLKLADIGAAPRRDAREIAQLAKREGLRTLIWRARETRDWETWDRALPATVKTVIATDQLAPPAKTRRRLWLHGRNPVRFRY